MDSSIVAWPSNPGLWYIQQRRTTRTFEADLSVSYPVGTAAAELFYSRDLAGFIAAEFQEIGHQRRGSWWKFPGGKSGPVLAGMEASSCPITTEGWRCLADCSFGVATARELGLDALAQPETVTEESPTVSTLAPMICITATTRPGLLARLSVIGVQPILPVCEFRSQLLVGPVLGGALSPCLVCWYVRLAAGDLSLDAFQTRSLAAESQPALFTSRDLMQGLTEEAARPAVKAAAAAIRWVIASCESGAAGTMARFDLVTGRVYAIELSSLPGAHNDHWLKPQFMQVMFKDYFHGIPNDS